MLDVDIRMWTAVNSKEKCFVEFPNNWAIIAILGSICAPNNILCASSTSIQNLLERVGYFRKNMVIYLYFLTAKC